MNEIPGGSLDPQYSYLDRVSVDASVSPTLGEYVQGLIGNKLPVGVWSDTSAATNNTSLFTEPLSPARKAKNVQRSSHPGPHVGASYSTNHIEVRPAGSGINGPVSADVGLSVSAIKSGWEGSTPGTGELDALYVVLRNSGPDSSGGTTNSDGSALLMDVQNRGPVGFANAMEATVSNVDRSTFQYTRNIGVQVGVVNTLTTGQQSYGYVAIAKDGDNDAGVFVQTQGSATWGKYILCATAGVEKFYVSPTQVYAPTLDAVFRSITVLGAAAASSDEPSLKAGNYTIDPDADYGKLIVFASSAAVTCTLPNNAKPGFRLRVIQRDPGQVTFVGAAGAIGPRNPDGHTKTKGQWARVDLEVSANAGGSAAVWYLSGATAA